MRLIKNRPKFFFLVLFRGKYLSHNDQLVIMKNVSDVDEIVIEFLILLSYFGIYSGFESWWQSEL